MMPKSSSNHNSSRKTHEHGKMMVSAMTMSMTMSMSMSMSMPMSMPMSMTRIMPRLPTELIRDILYKYGGLEHPCVKHLAKSSTYMLNRRKCDNQIRTRCPPDCTGEHIGWSPSCYDHDGINHHQTIVNMYMQDPSTYSYLDIQVIVDQISTASKQLRNLGNVNYDLVQKRQNLEQRRSELEKNQGKLEKAFISKYTLSINMLVYERLMMCHQQVMEQYDHIRTCSDQIMKNDQQIEKLTKIRNLLISSRTAIRGLV